MPMRPESLRRAAWAGLQDGMPRAALLSLHARVEGVKPPLGDEWRLAEDEAAMRAEEAAPARLLPSGDAYFLFDGAERELLVPRADQRQRL
jgi:hypothetical protein